MARSAKIVPSFSARYAIRQMRYPPSTLRDENLQPWAFPALVTRPLALSFGVKNESPTSMSRHGYLMEPPPIAFGCSIPFSISYMLPLGLGCVGLLFADRLGGQG